MTEQVLGDCSMRACGQSTELYLVKKSLSSLDCLRDTLKLERIEGSEIRLGTGTGSWVRRDGEPCEDDPEYIWIVARRIP